jgi:predicted dehydrogenase
MSGTDDKLQVTLIGGGMITADQVLPALYQLQRLGVIGDIRICALNAAPLRALAENEMLLRAFPGQTFTPYPDYRKVDPNEKFPDLFREVMSTAKPLHLAVVAVPDQLHYGIIQTALECNQHVLTVKPLVLNYAQAEEIEHLAYQKGLVVGVEYHKRFDDRTLIARRRYRAGEYGEFRVGQAHLVEPWYYRHSNFQNWCTVRNSDMFSYIACHYIDLVHFVTGLLPVEVSVYGIVDKYPNGADGFLWTDGRVIWDNGACLSVLNGMGYPDVGPGGNSQGLYLFTQGKEDGGILCHSDQYRGVKHCMANLKTGAKHYNEPNPDYLQFVDVGGGGLAPVGYGYRSIEYICRSIRRVNAESGSLEPKASLAKRQELLKQLDAEGIMATPANSKYNELVMEAGRLSILHGGRPVVIQYGKKAGVRFKKTSEYPEY